MAQEPSWEDLFTSAHDESRPTAAPHQTAVQQAEPDAAPTSRRQARQQHRPGGGSRGGSRGPRGKRRLGWLWALISVVAFLGVAAGAAWMVWSSYEEQIRSVMGWELPNDYEGTGNGEEVTIVITAGETGSDVANSLVKAGVTMTYDAFYDLAVAENPTFTPGAYALQKEMSARAALDALMDPANKVTAKATIREGVTLQTVFTALSEKTGVPIADYEAAAADPAAFGVPAEAPSLEGYLFPATYEFDPGVSAHDQIARLVDTMMQKLDALGVAPADRHRVVTTASLIQREARIDDDFFKVSRVIQNRLATGMMLQFDSTSHYGYAVTHGQSSAGGSVFTTDAERADPNPFNTYAHTGLPVGPIAAPGDVALDAALHPAEGTWLYFVTVNLETGETKFTTTGAEHSAAVTELRAWCKTSELC
ncbi:endolytic transglycosylase MltG [Diaminobutyricimonas sp. LJ205]|uniref:endolytic transglycosylase MltG n=1 Tax=Diaminobutyricimonas sp. LJ205 TaxID=2683590 RepID=UPI001E2BA808|nr:endolytic transglycosylase MltG [Diaminobutyricimonas sp. LJ205]